MVVQTVSQNAAQPVTQLDTHRRTEIEVAIWRAVERDATSVALSDLKLYFSEHALLLAERKAIDDHNQRLLNTLEDQRLVLNELQAKQPRPVSAQEIIDLHQHLG